MSDSYKPHRPTAKRLFRQVGSRYAFSNQTLLLFLIPAFGSGLIFDQIRLDSSFPFRFLVTSVGYVATILPLLVAKIFLPDRPRPSKPVVVMTIFFLTGFSRGAALLGISIVAGEYEPGEEAFRLGGAPIFTLVTLTVCAVIAANYGRHWESLDQLATERYRLQIRSAGVRAKVELQREELLAKVRNLIDPAIRGIQDSLAKEPSIEVIQSIRSTVDDVIRPLSAEVAQGGDELELEVESAGTKEKAPLPAKIVVGEFLLPFWAAILSALSIISVSYLTVGPRLAPWFVLLTFITIFAFVGLFQILTSKLQLPTVATGIVVPFLYGMSVVPLLLAAPGLGFITSPQQLWALVIFEVVLGGSLFFAQLVQFQRKLTTERLFAVNQELEILKAKLRQELWLNRRRTASVLHGPIQAALYASAMKLSQDSSPSIELIAEVEKDIQQALEKLNNPSNHQLESISGVLEQIVELWGDSSEISIDVPKDLEAVISRQPLATEATIEVIREFVTNGVKHGKATKQTVSIRRIDQFRFAVEVIDNGTGPTGKPQPGLGSKLLTELSLRWKQERRADETISYAEIVLSDPRG